MYIIANYCRKFSNFYNVKLLALFIIFRLNIIKIKMIRAFMKFIWKKIQPLQISSSLSDIAIGLNSTTISKKEDIPGIDKPREEEEEKQIQSEEENIYVGIDNTDFTQRIQHNICNLIGLDEDELAYIEEMNCKSMFEIVKLLNKAVVSIIDGIMEID